MSEVLSTDIRMHGHPGTFDATFGSWKATRIALTRAIDDYLVASSGLCNALASATIRPSTRYSLKQTQSRIDLELFSLQSEEEKLKQTRLALASQQSRSQAFPPIYKLPSEILVAIFTVASGRYTRNDRTRNRRATHVSPIVLSGVCSSWRQLATRAPSLWSYIDITIGGVPFTPCSAQTRLWLERSRNVPLYINIRDRNYVYPYVQYDILDIHVAELAAFLAPLMPRVRALDIWTTLGIHGVLPSVMECWVKNGSSGIKKTLQLFTHIFDDQVNISLGPAPGGSVSVEEFNIFLRSFSRIFVQSCAISDRIAFHEGLVELHLQEMDDYRCPTQQEFAMMLSACPGLRILVLANCWIEPSDETPSPVTLNHLESLSLESEPDIHGFQYVLPLLIIGSEALSMSLTLDDEPDFIAEAKAFFSRTKVTRLCIRNRQPHVSLTALLCPIPYLETLAIEGYCVVGQAFADFFKSNHDGRSMIPWPRLHTLYLLDLSINMTCLRRLAALHPSLKMLHVYRPCVAGSGAPLTDKECGRIKELMYMVEDFVITFDSHNSPLDSWDFLILPE